MAGTKRPWPKTPVFRRGFTRRAGEKLPLTAVKFHDIDRDPAKFKELEKYDVLDDVIKLSQEDLMVYVTSFLFASGYPEKLATITKDYAYFEGQIPILLIAHLDTVHAERVTKIYQHVTDRYLIAREGIGGDDRCGVFAILYIVIKGYKPSILFTTDEEKGTVGARAAAKELKPSKDIKYMVEIDRRGSVDSVYYDNDNKDFKKYIDSFGFKEANGSFSDISVLGDAWNISSVNLSSGYYEAHSTDEKIRIDETFATAKKVIAMLEKPPEKRFEHVEAITTWRAGWGAGVAGYYGDMYDEYGGYGYGPVFQPGTPKEMTDEEIFAGIAVKHLEKANKCFDHVTKLPYVSKVYAKDVTKTDIDRTDMPYFMSSIDKKTHWIADISKKSTEYYKMLTPEEARAIEPCISFLVNIYKQYKMFDAALRKFRDDPAKWRQFIIEMHKKSKITRRPAEKLEKMNFDDLQIELQYRIIDDCIDCIENLKLLHFVRRVSVEPGRVVLSVQLENVFMAVESIGILLKEKTFMEILKPIPGSRILIDCMLNLDMRIKAYNGLDRELVKEINRIEKRGKAKTVQTTIGPAKMASFGRLSPGNRKSLIEYGMRTLDMLENLKFMKAVSVDKRSIAVNFIINENSSMNASLRIALDEKEFVEQLKKYYPKDHDAMMVDFRALIAMSNKYDDYLEVLVYVKEESRQEASEKLRTRVEKKLPAREQEIASKQKEEILGKVVDLITTKEDSKIFTDLWRESGGNYVEAYKKFASIKKKGFQRETPEDVFDDAPACKKGAKREIVDRFEDVERGEEEEEELGSEMDAQDAIEILENHFNTYTFMFDPSTDCDPMFIDEEGVERPLVDLMTEIDATRNMKARQLLKTALETAIEYGYGG